MENEIIQKALLELRRGIIILAVLSQLDEEKYGYNLLKLLADKGFVVEQGTLYPLLRRLESQGLLNSSWKLEEPHPRRYYVISQEGQETLPRLIEEWRGIEKVMNKLLGD
jgi:DNA-binding PadR family transcriptional regulator